MRRSAYRKNIHYLYVIFCFNFILISAVCKGQEVPGVVQDENIEKQIETLAQTADENTDFTELAENLKYYLDHPINIRKTNKEELLRLNLLTDLQVEALLAHTDKNGPLLALQELQTIRGFDLETIRSILPYIRLNTSAEADRSSLGKIMKNGTHQLLLRTQRVLEDQHGFLPAPEGGSINSLYHGDPWKIYGRYRFTYLRKISAGITAEKDQGEEFFKGTQKSFDFYSAHFLIRDAGAFKVIALGDYQLEYGQGLTLWSGLAFGKSSEAINIKKNAQGIRPYTSVNENLFRRGAALAIAQKNFQLDVFYSDKSLDANLTDTLELIEQFSSFQESGYHRTNAELADKGAVNEKMFGGHLKYSNRTINIGATAFKVQYDKSLSQSPSYYNTFYFKNSETFNAGIDYSYLYRNFSFFGEVSRSDNGSIAYLNGALVSLDPRLAFSVLNRNYPRDYHGIYANALRESSNNFNERGTFLGINARPHKNMNVSGYFDVFTFPWLRFLVKAPSAGYEYLAQLTYTPSRKSELYFRIKQTVKETGAASETLIDYLREVNQVNYRFNVVTRVSSAFTLHSRVEIVNYSVQDENPDNGYLIFQDVNFRSFGSPVSLSFRYAIFDTRSYDSRIYAYENDVQYVYSIPAYYYKGSRYYLTLQYRILKGVDMWLRYAQTAYINRNIIGSGQDEIKGNKRSEIKMQLRFEF